jgi:hypothetical protein
LAPLGGAWFYNRFERFTDNPPALPEVTELRKSLGLQFYTQDGMFTTKKRLFSEQFIQFFR